MDSSVLERGVLDMSFVVLECQFLGGFTCLSKYTHYSLGVPYNI